MKSIYIAIAREDTQEASSKVVGIYNTVESAKADLTKRFCGLINPQMNTFEKNKCIHV